MSASEITDLSRLAIHTMTTKPWDLETCAEKYSAAGVGGITVWRQWLEGRDPVKAGKMLMRAGLDVVSLCRGGFFPAANGQARGKAIDENLRCIEEAHALGAPMVVLVCGADPTLSLEENRLQIVDGIAACLPEAEDAQVKLAIEPLHPMYAGDRSAVNTLRQANDMCSQLDSPMVGVAVDVYHLWWDQDLEKEIRRCGRNKWLAAFHICDWLTPTQDMLNDRGLMGEGCINIRQIREWVEQTGFSGYNEVEIFSNRWWQEDQDEYLKKIRDAYLTAS